MIDSSALSLHLFECLIALVQEQSVTRAAERMDLSQPQMSRMLLRLREITNDPLLVRTAGGMIPTALAIEIATSATPFLSKIESLISCNAAFTPETARNVFRVQTVDYFVSGIMAELIGIIGEQAPHVKVVMAPPRLRELRETLESGEADIVISQFAAVADTLYASKLLDLPLCCIVRANHPQIGKEITLEQYSRLPHVALGFGRDHDPYVTEQRIDKALEERGLSRIKSVFAHSVLSIPNIVANSNFIGNVPRSTGEAAAAHLPIQIMPLPLSVSASEIFMVWHQRTHEDRAQMWLRQMIRALAQR